MIHCIYCGAGIIDPVKEWTYHKNYYHVKFYQCKKCHFKFMEYYHNGSYSHTIPRFVGPKKKIINYLRNHGSATAEEIAKVLKLQLNDVLTILEDLEKERIIL